ncbi:hypothetical protein [Demequina subtropica]|uniref:hypothetical protein n=1 Tax=Demequina subtropica TaxID=1638989 RepID=UPI000782AB20|nr:hypothetical protein [Demequina subtropica]
MKAQQSTGVWMLAGTIVAVIMAALAWFLLISPEVDAAAEANDLAATAADHNDLIELQIAQMAALENDVPDWREQMAKIAMDMPPTPESDAVYRLIAETMASLDLPVVQLGIGKATTVDPGALTETELPTIAEAQGEDPDAPASPEPTPSPEATVDATDDAGATDDGSGTSTDETSDGASAGTPTSEVLFEGLQGMAVTITTEGDHATLLELLYTLSTQKDRFFTVTGLSIQQASEIDETPGRPALTRDDWTVTITGLVFSLVDDTLSYPADEDGEVASYSKGSKTANVFEPLPQSVGKGE